MSSAVGDLPCPGGGSYQTRAHDPPCGWACGCKGSQDHRGEFTGNQGADIPGGYLIGRARVIGSTVKHIGAGKLIDGTGHEHGGRDIEQVLGAGVGGRQGVHKTVVAGERILADTVFDVQRRGRSDRRHFDSAYSVFAHLLRVEFRPRDDLLPSFCFSVDHQVEAHVAPVAGPERT